LTRPTPRIGAVVLTYNSSEELPDCLAGLKAQTGVELNLIVVDNASRPDERARMETDFLIALPEGRVLDATEADSGISPIPPAAFLRNETNNGYSAGNNIGARMAASIGCDAVLIINPDVRLDNPRYILTLCKLIWADQKTAVACSALHNLLGMQENPMREPGFIVEFLWPVEMIAAGLFRFRKNTPPLPDGQCRVEKVSGACFMIRTDFLLHIGFFDEVVFLYCEEAILMAQVRDAGWDMMMDPSINALHAHLKQNKTNSLRRFSIWTESRRKFHMYYGGYSPFRQSLLAASRGIILTLIRIKNKLNKLKAGFKKMVYNR